jgi:MFS family permease
MPTMKARRRLFTALVILAITINLDGGAVPASVDTMVAYFQLEAWQTGLLGALVYIGIASGSINAAALLRRISPLQATRIALILNLGATFGFAMSVSPAMLLVFRFLIGFLQAVPMVYFPVWVDEFAPKASTTLWIALIQGGAPLGITFGYVLAGVLTQNAVLPDAVNGTTATHGEWSMSPWRVAFLVQCSALTCFAIGSFFVPPELYNTPDPADIDAIIEGEAAAEAAAAEAATAAAAESPSERSGRPGSPTGTSTPSLWSPAPSSRLSHMSDVMSHLVMDVSLSLNMAPQPTTATLTERREPFLARPFPSAMAAGADGRDRAWTTAGGPPALPPALASQASNERHSAPESPNARPRSLTDSQAGMYSSAAAASRGRADTGGSDGAIDLAARRSQRLSRSRIVSVVDGLRGRQVLDVVHERSEKERYSAASAASAVSATGTGTGGEQAEHGSGALSGEAKPGSAAVTAAVAPSPSDGLTAAERRRRSPLRVLCGTKVYIYMVIALACLYFVVTGIQFWVTSYLIVVLGARKADVVPAFGVTAITAPLLGVILGGKFVDFMGGSRGAHGIARTIKCCMIFGALAGTAAIGCSFVPRSSYGFPLAIALISFTLLFGGAIIPAATGVLMASVPTELRKDAIAVAQFTYQLLGYASAPLISALIMEVARAAGIEGGDALALGYRVVMFWSLLALFAIINAFFAARRSVKLLVTGTSSTADALDDKCAASEAASLEMVSASVEP